MKTNNKTIKDIECKFVHFIPGTDKRKDTHIVKEAIHYEDGTIEPNLKLVYDYKRPFWITKEFYRNHKQKKESESLSKLNMYYSTQTDLPKNIARRLNVVTTNPNLRDLSRSPYLYGIDVDSRVFLKHDYREKYGEVFSNYTVCVLDTEVDIDTDELIVLSVATENNVYVGILSKLVKGLPDVERQLKYLYQQYIPKTEISENVKVEYEVLETEIEILQNAMSRVHKWKPDFLTAWNMLYDIGVLLKVCEKYQVDPADIFSDPDLPPELKYFRFSEDKAGKVTASGVNKPPGPQEKWHKLVSAASFYFIDAMCAYNYVRVGRKAVVGGYGLDSVLKTELGDKLKKLKFEDDESSKLVGVDWHRYMVSKKPLEYIIYNVWDVLSVLELDKKTLDLKVSVPVLSGDSSFDNFKSGPKKIIDNIHFFYNKRDRVLGCRDKVTNTGESEIDLSDWIVLLLSHRVMDNGYNSLIESNEFNTNTKTHVFDADR